MLDHLSPNEKYGMMCLIRQRDPDIWQWNEPKAADYEAFETWVRSHYGDEAWKHYHTGWGLGGGGCA